MNKTERLQIRITSDMKEKLEALAASESRNVSNYIENLIIREWDKKCTHDAVFNASLHDLDRIESIVSENYDKTISLGENLEILIKKGLIKVSEQTN